jgi:predicted O-linked N-acetylglucosamine transferase (SPINDLY family)
MSQLTIEQAFQTARQHHQAGQFSQAENLYRQILAQQPLHVDSLHYLGVMAGQLGQNHVAVDLIRQAVTLQPDNAKACNNLGFALRSTGRLEEAVAAIRRAVALDPNYAEAYNNLGVALRDLFQLDESLAACHQAIAFKPDFADAYRNLGNALKDTGQLQKAIDAYRQAIIIRPHFTEAHSNLILCLHYDPNSGVRAIAEECNRWNTQHAQPLKKLIEPHLNDRSPDRRLKIGYVSSDFRDHPVGRFLLPLFTHHDKTQVEVFAYANLSQADAITQNLRLTTDHWQCIHGIGDAQAAEMIRRDQIDILVDLTLHTANNRLLVFARKPAPVQVTYLAYCSSSGLESIDYRLSDPYFDPLSEDESIYSEQTIRLPQTYWCYQPAFPNSHLSPTPALERGLITFGSLNNFCKVTDPALSAWVKILQAVPRSQLLLYAHQGRHRQRLLDRLHRDGIESKRVQFVGRMPTDKYFELYRQIDIALDTFTFAGGATTCDALWMGVPVITLAGKSAVGRAGLSILSNVGLRELIARSQDEYVQIAIALARDIPRLTDLRSTLRSQMQASPLMDANPFARNIESAYRQAWRKWCETSASHS